MLLLATAHCADLSHLYRVQNRRYRANIVLTQQQAQQAPKMLCLPVGLSQDIVKLFQSRKEDFPKLVQNLGASVIP